MKKQNVIIVLSCLISALLVLSVLYFTTPMPNQENNGFTRNWLPNPIVPLHQNTTSLPISIISGATNTSLFFSASNPSWILMTDTALRVIDTLIFTIQATPQLAGINIAVDSPAVYMYANNISYLISGKIPGSELDTIKLHTPLFTRTAQVSPELLIIRGLDSTQQQQVFKQIDCKTGRSIRQAVIIENQQDPGFSTDGFLNYDSLTKKLVYVQVFQNKFFCLDTSLNLLYAGKTIDTSSTIKGAIKQVESGGQIKLMPNASRQVVNQGCDVNNGYLFIASSLRADNETIADFNSNTPIDVYEINNGKYISSFYVPTIKGKKMSSLLIRNNLIVALYKGGHTATFSFNNTQGLKNLTTAHLIK